VRGHCSFYLIWYGDEVELHSPQLVERHLFYPELVRGPRHHLDSADGAAVGHREEWGVARVEQVEGDGPRVAEVDHVRHKQLDVGR
jgi:hypothetical protein